MCDALTMAIVAGGASLLSAGVSYAGQSSMMQAQQKANDDWVAYQRQASQKAAQEDEQQRQAAETARQSTLATLTPQSQEQTQQTKAADLNQKMLAANNNPAGDANVAMLSGQGQNSNTAVSSDISARVTDAARAARTRIAALANLQGYQGGYGSMMDTSQINLQKGDQAIALASDKRKGDTAVLGAAQAVPVQTYTQGSDIAGSIAGALGNLAGSAFGSYQKTA